MRPAARVVTLYLMLSKDKAGLMVHGRLTLVLVAFFAVGCGDNLYDGRDRGYYGGKTVDAGVCVYANGGRRYACGCADRPYDVAVAMKVANGTTLESLDTALLPSDRGGLPAPVTPPAQGTPAADGYWVATLMSEDGEPLGSSVFGARHSPDDAGYRHGTPVELAVPLVPAAAILRIENWDSGQVLIDLDLRGHLQVLCIDRPCLSICSAARGSSDAGAGEDGPEDAPAAVDAAVPAMDAGAG